MGASGSAPQLPRARQRQLRIAVCGPPGAGKSTFIRTISEMIVLSNSEPTRDGAESAGGGQEVGRIALGNGLALNLLSAPDCGALRTWGPPTGLLGAVVLVNLADAPGLPLAAGMAAMVRRDAHVPMVVAATRADRLDEVAAHRLRTSLGLPRYVPVMGCDPRLRAEVRDVLVALLSRVLQVLDREAASGGAGT